VVNSPSRDETAARERSRVDRDKDNGSATSADGVFKVPASPERTVRHERAAVRMPERDEIVGEAASQSCEIVIRASERIPSPVRGPSVAAPAREIVRAETAARTEVLAGTVLDARTMRIPRAGECSID
jgi:hypothetical protein